MKNLLKLDNGIITITGTYETDVEEFKELLKGVEMVCEGLLVKLYSNNTQIGSALIIDYGDGEIFLSNFEIDEKYRGMGHGEKSLQYLIDKYGVNSLVVGVNNEVAKHIYQNAGFKIVKESYFDENANEEVYYMRRC